MLSRSLLLHKLNAMAVSLGVFAFFSTCLWLVTWFYLYPDYLFWLDGGLQGLRLVLVVDLILGPLIAFIIYNPDKPRRELLLDIVLVVMVQFSAMAWGCYQVWSQRPVAVVYGADRFVPLMVDILEVQKKTPADLLGFSEQRPPLIYRREPQGKEEKTRFGVMVFRNFVHADAQFWLFEKFEPNRAQVFADSDNVLRHVESKLNKEWKGWLADHGKPSGAEYQLAFFQGRYGNAVLIFSRGGSYVDFLPWPGKIPAVGKVPAAPASVNKAH